MAWIYEAGDRRLFAEGSLVPRQGRRYASAVAGRGRAVAYFAGFHAAQAWIAEHDGSASKTHSGVQAQFARLLRNDSRFDAELRAFLGRAYNLKAVTDYEIGPAATVTADQAMEATRVASRMVELITNLSGPVANAD